MSRWIGYSLVAAAGAGVLVWVAQRSLYYPMRHPVGDWAQAAALGVRDVWLTTSDGVRLHGWWKPVEGAAHVVLFLHGNAGNVTHRDLHLREIARAGASVLVLDYRGYGRSEGRPTEDGLYRDADAAYQWLRGQGWLASQIVLHGESLGSAVAVDLATRMPCAGVVLEAPFTSVRAVAARVVPGLGPLLVGGFDSKAKIGRLKVPLLVIHGERDEIIDYSFGRELFESAPEPKQFWSVPGAGHNNLLMHAAREYAPRLRAFYESLAG
jgi:uncharacterized protein